MKTGLCYQRTLCLNLVQTLFGESLCESPQARQAVGSQLVQDARQHLCKLFGLSVAGDGEGVSSEGGLDFGVVEVDDCSLICEHVDLQRNQCTNLQNPSDWS